MSEKLRDFAASVFICKADNKIDFFIAHSRISSSEDCDAPILFKYATATEYQYELEAEYEYYSLQLQEKAA